MYEYKYGRGEVRPKAIKKAHAYTIYNISGFCGRYLNMQFYVGDGALDVPPPDKMYIPANCHHISSEPAK